MAAFVFRGRFLPELLGATLDSSPAITRVENEGDGPVHYQATLRDGRLEVRVETAGAADDGFERLHGPAQDMARAIADVICLRTGVAYLVVFDDVVLPSGVAQPLVLADRALAAITTPLVSGEFEKVLDLALLEPAVARVLSDLTSMLTWPHYAPIAAGRVVDGVLRLLTGGREGRHWAELRDALRVDRAYLQLVTDNAAPPRHGDRLYVPADLNKELARRAWTVVARYVEFRLHGPLDPDANPVLTG